METFFRALADRTRLRLLHLIAGQEVCVCYLVEILGLPQPTISQHLAYLRKAGLVRARRQGKWMHYRLAEPRHAPVRAIFSEVLRWLAADKEMQHDRAKLERARCRPQAFVRLEGAPVPQSLPAATEARS